MDLEIVAIIIALAGVILNTLAMVAGAVWVVAAVKGSTGELGVSISHLSESIDKLHDWLSEVDKEQHAHGERLARLEERV